MKSGNIVYVPGIDHLRAYVALLIVAYHGFHLFHCELKRHSPFDFIDWIVANNPDLNGQEYTGKRMSVDK